MNSSRFFVLTLLGIFLFTACHKEQDFSELTPSASDESYLVFGHFYGMCFGESCIEIFKIEDNQLYEDTSDQYPNQNDFYTGNFTQLSQAQFDAVKDLVLAFPADLWNENEKVLGIPDAADGGGLYIEVNEGGSKRCWYIDQEQPNVPAYLHEFMDKVNEKIALLN